MWLGLRRLVSSGSSIEKYEGRSMKTDDCFTFYIGQIYGMGTILLSELLTESDICAIDAWYLVIFTLNAIRCYDWVRLYV